MAAKRIFVVLVFFVCGLPASSQMVLNAGESYTYRFTNMPQTSVIPFGGPSSYGGVTLISATNMGLEAGDVLLMELFEDAPTGNPIRTQTFTVSSNSFGGSVPDAWQDHTGSFRLTMLSGSGIIGSIYVESSTYHLFNESTFYGFAILPPPRPRLEFIPSPAALTLRWPTSALNFVLESSTNVIPPITWQTVTNATVTNSGKIFVTVNQEQERRFFRLRNP